MYRLVRLALWGVVICCAVTSVMAGGLWETDFEKAADAAKASHRYMLLDFSGSDWCGWCVRLDEEVFSRKDFKDYAKENLVCVLLDFPRRKSLKKSLKEQNQQLAAKYGIRGYPSVVILSPEGDKVGRTGYRKGGAEEYVGHLKSIIDPHRETHDVPAPTSTLKARSGARPPLRSPSPGPLARDENREIRIWTSRSGATVTAFVLEERGPHVILKQEDGVVRNILTSKLSDADRKYLAELRQKAATQPPPVRAK